MKYAVLPLVLTIVGLQICMPEAEARGFGMRGAGGRAGGFARNGQYGQSAGIGGVRYGRGAAGAMGGSYYGPNGGSFAGRGAGFATQNAAAGRGSFAGTGPNGGEYAGSGAGAWRRGVGGAERTNFNATGANGNAYSGYTRGAYNAQTGQGMYNSGKQYTNGQTGQQYGYDQSTNYMKGQGGETTIDTMNKGDYQVDWQKGTKPVVTEIPPAQPVSSSTPQ